MSVADGESAVTWGVRWSDGGGTNGDPRSLRESDGRANVNRRTSNVQGQLDTLVEELRVAREREVAATEQLRAAHEREAAIAAELQATQLRQSTLVEQLRTAQENEAKLRSQLSDDQERGKTAVERLRRAEAEAESATSLLDKVCASPLLNISLTKHVAKGRI